MRVSLVLLKGKDWTHPAGSVHVFERVGGPLTLSRSSRGWDRDKGTR